MKILVTVLLTALFVFALATTWVDVVQPHLERMASSTEKTAPTTENVSAKKKSRKLLPKPAAELLPVPTDDNESFDSEVARKVEPKARSSRGPRESAELLAQKLEEVKLQESSLAARQETLRMIYDDIRTELASVDNLRKRTSDDLVEAERRMLNVAQRKTPRLSSARIAPGPLRNSSENAAIRGEALIIRRLVNEGKIETAVSLLKSMKGRDAASVLEALSTMDSKLAVRLADTVPSGSDDTIRR